MGKSRKVIKVGLSVIFGFLLLFLMELSAHFALPNESRQPLLISGNVKMDEVFEIPDYCFDLFLGWTFCQNVKDSPHEVNNGVVELKSYLPNQPDTFRLLITGGSTSDLIFDNKSWPFQLFNILRDKLSIEIYCAAVGGYNSGQELLKTLTFLGSSKPDIHISYSGANEVLDRYGYVTGYENSVFQHLKAGQPFILGNTILFVRKMFQDGQVEMPVHREIGSFEVSGCTI